MPNSNSDNDLNSEFIRIQKEAKEKYYRNRLLIMSSFNKKIDVLAKIVKNGVDIDSEDECNIAISACSLVLSDLYWEQAQMLDKTGKFEW